MNSNEPTVVKTRKLEKTFRDFWRRPTVHAVAGVDLEVRAGEVFGLLGPNGSGKTTILKMMMGLLDPTGGSVSVLGREPRDVKAKNDIGYLPEESLLYKYLTAEETLDFYGALFGIKKRELAQRKRELLAMVGLERDAGRPVGEFSKGMSRRLGLAQALINNPRLLVLDEPTSGLDPMGCRWMKNLMPMLAANGTTIILSSHLLADVEDVCGRIAILYKGRILAKGGLNDLLQKKDRISISMKAPRAEDMPDLLNTLSKKSGEEPSVTHPAVSLEDYFVGVVQEASSAGRPTADATADIQLPRFLSSDLNR